MDPDERYDLEVIRSLGVYLEARLNLLPMDVHEALDGIKRKRLDMAIASISKTAARSRYLDFSLPNVLNTEPHGMVLMAPEVKGRPRMGVVGETVHSDYAAGFFAGEFHLCFFTSYLKLLQAAEKFEVDALLVYSGQIPSARKVRPDFRVLPGVHRYGTYTAIAVHPERGEYLGKINCGLERLHDEGVLESLSRSTGSEPL